MTIMPADRLKERTKVGAKSARMRDAYRKMLKVSNLGDQEIDEIRKHIGKLARTICEHVWGKRFY